MEKLIEQIKSLNGNIHGWCEESKALKMSQFIIERNFNLCVEIGVFGGASLLPQALSLKYNNKGVVFGIDPWDNESALESMTEEANIKWWGYVDLDQMYNHCVENIKKYEVENFCKLIKNKSENVCDKFKDNSIDMLHIDGNHSEDLAYKDATLYLSKVKRNGVIFFDDIHWTEDNVATTRKALSYLMEHCIRLELIDNCLILEKI
jgi:hypothetical protein